MRDPPDPLMMEMWFDAYVDGSEISVLNVFTYQVMTDNCIFVKHKISFVIIIVLFHNWDEAVM